MINHMHKKVRDAACTFKGLNSLMRSEAKSMHIKKGNYALLKDLSQ